MDHLKSAGKILVCLRYGIGDLVMETPCLDALRRHLPSAWIHVLGARPATDLLMRDPSVDGICSIQLFGFRHWGDEGPPEAKQKFKEWLKNERFDAVLDPSHAAFGAACAIWELGCRLFDAVDRRPDPVIMSGGGGVKAIKNVVSHGWGIHVPEESRPRIHIGLRDHLWAVKSLGGHFRENRTLIAISPVGSSSPKIWPMKKIVRLGRSLIEEGFDLLLIGGREVHEDLRLADLKRSERVLVAHGVHLLRVSALLSECNGLICNDTGLMHIAAAVGTPVIALFGPTEPSIYLPRRENAVAVAGDRSGCEFRERSAVGPSQCLTAGRCLNGEESCIGSIQVEQVVSALKELLQKRAVAG